MWTGVIFALTVISFQTKEIACQGLKLDPGSYSQWRELIPYTDSSNLPSCLDKCVAPKCGPEFKGAATCGAMFEFKDEPDPLDPTKTTYVHCFCQRSVTFERAPAWYCGPGRELCENTPAPEALPPPQGAWVDGLNTMIEENNIQGSAHLANVNNVVSQACYEFFHDETKVTRSEAKARCEAKGYILPEILTPQNWADFKAVADSIKKSYWVGLANDNSNPPNCDGEGCLDDGWYWESSNTPLSLYHIRLFKAPYLSINNGWITGCPRYHLSHGYLDDANCDTKMNAYICQKKC